MGLWGGGGCWGLLDEPELKLSGDLGIGGGAGANVAFSVSFFSFQLVYLLNPNLVNRAAPIPAQIGYDVTTIDTTKKNIPNP